MEKQLSDYLDAIRNDYVSWASAVDKSHPSRKQIRDKMVEDFCDQVRFSEGNKYIKVIQGNSVHSFIVKKDGGKFKKGDILKAASWAAPALNFARGNILDGGYSIRWTGA